MDKINVSDLQFNIMAPEPYTICKNACTEAILYMFIMTGISNISKNIWVSGINDFHTRDDTLHAQ